ncbi:ParA family protein [Zeimonas arvi]|uniref:ParA family protein n=1 Tax=Zeimonas arvi TaxID=2498847 RepID=A0A5C8NYU8_9BURK|nr:ParA family protein [Zeimonas arvi]TXL66175.1 ParA family protein [Zeimonas arvi]
MPVVAVVNPKGGVGKTTLATNLAGYFASTGRRTMLGDFDRQQSSAQWLKLRPPGLPPIETWAMNGSIARPPRGVTHVVLDTPAQLDGKRLANVVRVADRILVPLQPSMFDVLATGAFLESLREGFGNDADFRATVAVVGVRVDPRTHAAEQLGRFVASLDLPVAGALRDTQNYLHLAAHGLTLFDVPAQKVDKDLATWAPLLAWLEGQSGR